ncbi:hypothetical protein FRC11_013490 [Ceratobasidium sp. 423]|nr:hypothetical protein FRC11_013490 [Ceratobasidium sp. 423]
MSRKLRSGRNYDASKAPAAPKRCNKKCKVPEESVREEPRQTNRDKGEQATVPEKRGRLTFGTVAGDPNGPGERTVVVGTSKRRGIALTGDNGVMLSPSAYLALTHRAPPIRRVLSWLLPTVKTRAIADAPADGEATSQQSVEAAECAPVELVAAPGSAECVPAAIEAPTTPTTTTDSRGAESDNDVYVTARTSRVRDESIALDENGEPVLAHCTRSYIGKGKGKAKPKKKSKKRKRPSLGAVLDDLEGPHERSIIPTEPQNASVAYRGGGYLEGLVGSTPVPRERGRDRLRNKRAKAARSINSGSRVSRRHAETPTRASLAPPRRPPMPPSPSEPSGDDSDDSSYTHTSSNGGCSGSSDPSDSDPESSDDMRTNSSGRPCNHNNNRRLEKLVRKLQKQNRKLEDKIVMQARLGYKAQMPKPYKGDADIDKYDIFMFGYNLFIDDTKLSDSKAVLTVSRFLEDKAAAWYMLNVAPAPANYTLEAVYIGLYNYCFPPDFKEDMHKLYNEKKQGESGIQDYFAKLAQLRRRLREITDHQHVLRAWDSAAQYIRVGWALKGIRPELTTIDSLHEAALDIEQVHKFKHSIEKTGNDKLGTRRNRSRSPPRKNDRSSNYQNSGSNQAGGNHGDNKNPRGNSGNGNGNRQDKRLNNYKRNE